MQDDEVYWHEKEPAKPASEEELAWRREQSRRSTWNSRCTKLSQSLCDAVKVARKLRKSFNVRNALKAVASLPGVESSSYHQVSVGDPDFGHIHQVSERAYKAGRWLIDISACHSCSVEVPDLLVISDLDAFRDALGIMFADVVAQKVIAS